MPGNLICSLPTGVLGHIMSFLDPQSAASLSQTCRDLRAQTNAVALQALEAREKAFLCPYFHAKQYRQPVTPLQQVSDFNEMLLRELRELTPQIDLASWNECSCPDFQKEGPWIDNGRLDPSIDLMHLNTLALSTLQELYGQVLHNRLNQFFYKANYFLERQCRQGSLLFFSLINDEERSLVQKENCTLEEIRPIRQRILAQIKKATANKTNLLALCQRLDPLHKQLLAIFAVDCRYWPIIEDFMHIGVDLNAKLPHGATLLTKAAWFFKDRQIDSINLVQTLIALGAHVNAYNDHGMTPLHTAARRGHYSLVQLLINNGADVNTITEKKSNSPLHLAVLRAPNVATVRILMDNGANLQAQNTQGQTPLDLVPSKRVIGIVDHYPEYGRDKANRKFLIEIIEPNLQRQTKQILSAENNHQNPGNISWFYSLIGRFSHARMLVSHENRFKEAWQREKVEEVERALQRKHY